MTERTIVVVLRLVSVLTGYLLACYGVLTISQLIAANSTVGKYGGQVTGALANLGVWSVVGLVMVYFVSLGLYLLAPRLAELIVRE